eukprot:SAG22_NODE_9250_length_600_cov_2.696607_1_plen_72_part_00
MFLSPAVPKLAAVTVQTPKAWPTEVFAVDCDNDQLDIFKKPCGWVGARSSQQVGRRGTESVFLLCFRCLSF